MEEGGAPSSFFGLQMAYVLENTGIGNPEKPLQKRRVLCIPEHTDIGRELLQKLLVRVCRP